MEQRVIKFRGKSVKTGKWIYGSLIRRDQVDLIGGYEITPPTNSDPGGDTIWVEELVVRQTVGQWVSDINLNPATPEYDGDIVEYDTEDGIVRSIVEHQVTDNEGQVYISGFAYRFISSREYENDESVSFEVIGNIHDNPELINQK